MKISVIAPMEENVRPGLRETLEGLLRHVDQNTCAHEDTHRGGFLWTICDGCGQKWADDEGGFVPYSDPAPVVAARAALNAAPPAPPREDAKAGGSVDVVEAAEAMREAAARRADSASEGSYDYGVTPNEVARDIASEIRALSPSEVVHPLGATRGGSVEQSTEADCARKEGFIVDSHCYPWVAYKGARFNPTEWKYIRTDDECALSPRDGGQATGAEADDPCPTCEDTGEVDGQACPCGCTGRFIREVAEPDGAALADEVERHLCYLRSVAESLLVSTFTARIQRDMLAAIDALATLRTSAPPAQPSEAQVEALVTWLDEQIARETEIQDACNRKGDEDSIRPHVRATARRRAFVEMQQQLAATVAPLRETEPRPVDGAQTAFDAQSDDPAPGDWNDACRHIAELLRAPGEPRPVEECAECGGTGRSFDRVDGEITCPECGYPSRPVEQTGSGDAEIERLTLLVEQWKGTAEAEAEAFQEARKEADTFYADLARVTAERDDARKGFERLRANLYHLQARFDQSQDDLARLTEAAAADLNPITKTTHIPIVDPVVRPPTQQPEAAAAGSDVAGLRAVLEQITQRAAYGQWRFPLHSARGCRAVFKEIESVADNALTAFPDAGAGRTRGGTEGGR